jgi:FMN phosphatase YigB (HAD superfamily)
MTIKHISFDLWNTLITPNPEYAKARTEFLVKISGKGEEEVKRGYKELKDAAEHNILAKTSAEHASELLTNLGIQGYRLIRKGIYEAFNKYPPGINPSTISWLHRNKSNYGYSILSNTNFISGHALGPWLENQLPDLFQAAYFSDVEGVAKPSSQFFGKVLDLRRDLEPGEILHVGDSLLHDKLGAQRVGLVALKIDSPSTLVNQLETFLAEHY